MKLIIIGPKAAIKFSDLLNKLEAKVALFYEQTNLQLNTIPELKQKEPITLGLDETSLIEGFNTLNKYVDQMPAVKYICGLSARYHELDLDRIHKHGIIYSNNPDTTSQSVTELSLMHLFNLLRNQPLYTQPKFDFFGSNHLGHEAQLLTVGILGYGSIGRRIADMCQVLGMKVKIWSRTKKHAPYPQVSLKDVYQSDVIIIAVASNASSLFNQTFYRSLKPHQYVVDIVASDSLYDKNRVIKMVNQHKLAGFGFEAEKPSSTYLKSSGNISISPHVGWGTQESYRRFYQGWVKTILAAYNQKPINVIS